MEWQEARNVLKNQWSRATDDGESLFVSPDSGGGGAAVVRVSYSEKSKELGFISDVATADGITEREVAVASRSLAQGSLVVLGGRIVLRHRAPAPALLAVDLLRLVRALASSVGTLRFRWTMPVIAA